MRIKKCIIIKRRGVAMNKISKEQSIFTFSKEHKPAAYIKSGESIIFETSDCFNGQLTSEGQSTDAVKGEYLNPATGPLYIEDAQIGDIIRIEILNINVADKGIMTADTHDELVGELYNEDRVKVIPIKDNIALFNEIIELPINPMIGVIGVAPVEDEFPTIMPGSYGGNMDCREITKGAVLYLPVNVEGALLAVGDLHAIMGDGETGGCGLEVSGEVTVKIDIIKNRILPLPILVQNNKLMTIATQTSIDDANKQAVVNMHKFLVNELEMDTNEAGLLISLAADLRVCQIVDPLKTARMELPISILNKYGYIMA